MPLVGQSVGNGDGADVIDVETQVSIDDELHLVGVGACSERQAQHAALHCHRRSLRSPRAWSSITGVSQSQSVSHRMSDLMSS
jgi:hypothetical protein